MTTLKNGEHTNYKSKNGTEYWVMNLNVRYYVNRRNSVYGMKEVKATKEIKENITLV